ncbi:MAG: hypothetical protein RIS82_611 [Actinomycetota bacterium]|jgi:hypothetical protein
MSPLFTVNGMIDFDVPQDSPSEFRLALEALRYAQVRDELDIEPLPAPPSIGAFAITFKANVKTALSGVEGDAGTGRFVMIWEPEPQEAWASNFRIVCFAKSPLETNIGADEQISDVVWAWLTEALANRHASYGAIAGTATRIMSTGYGSLSSQHDHAELELRASWSPLDTNVASSFEAWLDLICIMSGFPNLPTGVTSLDFTSRR